MAGKLAPRSAQLQNHTNPNDKGVWVMGDQPGSFTRLQAKSFWQPVYSSFPFRRMGNWMRSVLGFQASGPVNIGRSWGSVSVTPELSLMLSAVWACTGRYQNTVATTPLNMLRGTGDNAAKPYRNHPLHRVLHDQPNLDQSAATFWKGFVGQMMTWGAGYARILRGSQGQVVGLKPLLSAFMTIYFDANQRLRYRYQPGGFGQGAEEDFAASEIFVVIDRTMDGYAPLSRIQYGANSLGGAIAADRAASLAFKNGLRASGILTIAQWLKPDQREAYREKVNQFVGTGTGESTDQQFGVLVAENATKFEAINIKPQDVELLASRRFSVEDVARWYDVPPILISHAAEGQTMWGSGIEQIILGWLKLGLAPVLRTIEQEIWRQLITPAEQAEGVFAEFNLDALLRGDSTARAAFYASMAQNGIRTRNEIRAIENLPPQEGGDVLTVQSNLTPLAGLGNIGASNDAQQVRAALRAFLGLEEPPNGPEA